MKENFKDKVAEFLVAIGTALFIIAFIVMVVLVWDIVWCYSLCDFVMFVGGGNATYSCIGIMGDCF